LACRFQRFAGAETGKKIRTGQAQYSVPEESLVPSVEKKQAAFRILIPE
jgi:hypothetical protein